MDELNPTGLPQVMDEVVRSGAAQRTYLYGLRRISQTQVASETTSYYGYDAHGDVRYLMNSGGAVTDTYDYDAFGNIVGSTGTTPNVYRYQGEALDSETGLYYMRARYYDPTVGRYLNVDPMTDQGEHPSEYAAADPVNGHDPTGEQDVIEYSLLMWLYTIHVPPPRSHISCWDSIIYSGGSAGSVLDAIMGQCKGTWPPRPGPPPKPPATSGPPKPCCVSASSVDAYLGTKTSPMTGQGSSFMATGAKYDLDPRLLVSLAGAESTFGKILTTGTYNALNVMYNGYNSPFNSWQSNINAAGRSITHPANGYDLTNTATLYSKYCSGACADGLTNLNRFMREQGADTNALHDPCSSQSQK